MSQHAHRELQKALHGREVVESFDRLKVAHQALILAGDRTLLALAANGAGNCEAAKEMRAALSLVRGEG